jgi:hypothetical protein
MISIICPHIEYEGSCQKTQGKIKKEGLLDGETPLLSDLVLPKPERIVI